MWFITMKFTTIFWEYVCHFFAPTTKKANLSKKSRIFSPRRPTLPNKPPSCVEEDVFLGWSLSVQSLGWIHFGAWFFFVARNGLWTIFRLGNPEINLHLWLESWVGGRPNVWNCSKLHDISEKKQTCWRIKEVVTALPSSPLSASFEAQDVKREERKIFPKCG